MIRDLGGGIPSIHSQTVNLCGHRIPYLKVIEGPVECQSLVGHVLVSRTGDAGWTEREVKVPEYTLIRDHERCESIQTAGRWPWKLESAKECVTTHLPNGLALKMDGAQACYSYLTVNFVLKQLTSRQAWGSIIEAQEVIPSGEAFSADLGGSSKYSSENLEDWSGERFHVNCDWPWVSRS